MPQGQIWVGANDDCSRRWKSGPSLGAHQFESMGQWLQGAAAMDDR
jgi:hypothetical protein